MSRSYKKTPVVKDKEGVSKSMVSRIIRRKSKKVNSEIPNGSAYKKYFDSWEIHDQICHWSKEQAIAYYNGMLNSAEDSYIKTDYKDLEDFLKKEWEKHFKRK